MKIIKNLQFENQTLTVLVQNIHGEDDNKGFVSYFIDGEEVAEWDKLSKIQQNFFSSLATHICTENNLIKWSY